MARASYKKVVALLLVMFAIGTWSQMTHASFQGQRVVILDFLALDAQGKYIDTLSFAGPDLTNLSRVMSQGIASRLVQHGEFNVQDSISQRTVIDNMNFAHDTSAWERAQVVLEAGIADQVITGSITMLQSTAVIGVQRFEMRDGHVQLVGSSMSSAPKVTDAPALVDNLLTDLFPANVQVIERSIDQVFAVPSQVRLNLGQSKQLAVYALDALGRPVASPQFLFFSADESKVSVDENGVIKGLQPGVSTITVRAISRTTRSGSPATMTVTVLPPTFGIRAGSTLARREITDGFPIRLGLRLTPTIDQKGSQVAPPPTAATPQQALPVESSNPLSLISSFFGSMLTNGLMTIDLDFDPSKELLVSFSGVQRSSGGYLGTGVGYVTRLDNLQDQQGFVLRFTVGTQYRATNRLSLPVEAVMDAIFPTANLLKPTFRIGINLGLDLFP